MLVKPTELLSKNVDFILLNLLVCFLLSALAMSCAGWGKVRFLLGVGPLSTYLPCAGSSPGTTGTWWPQARVQQATATATDPALCKPGAMGCRKAHYISQDVINVGLQ